MENSSAPNASLKKLLIDVTFLFDQYTKRGIGQYGRNVVKGIILESLENNLYEINLLGFLNLQQNLIALDFSSFQIEEIQNKMHFYTLGEPYHSTIKNVFSWPLYYVPIINKVKPDVYFAAHFERGLPTTETINQQLTHHTKTVVMAHDAIPLAINKFSSKGFIQNKLKERFFRLMWSGVVAADLVMTNTNFSKNDLVKFGGITEDKIKVSYLGIDQEFFNGRTIFNKDIIDQTLDLYSLKSNEYYFYDSGVEPNKSPEELLTMLKALTDVQGLPKVLALTGSDFEKGVGKDIKPRTVLGENFLRIARKLGVIDNIVTTDKVSRDHLIELLLEARAYMNLSSYEGFSFGPVQAMAARIPAIAANASCTPEVTDGGAYLVDLEKVRDSEAVVKIAKEIKKFLNDDIASHLRKAQNIAKRYSWSKTVDETIAEIKKIS